MLDELESLALKLWKRVGCGKFLFFVGVDFRIGPDGKPYMIDFNRSPGGLTKNPDKTLAYELLAKMVVNRLGRGIKIGLLYSPDSRELTREAPRGERFNKQLMREIKERMLKVEGVEDVQFMFSPFRKKLGSNLKIEGNMLKRVNPEYTPDAIIRFTIKRRKFLDFVDQPVFNPQWICLGGFDKAALEEAYTKLESELGFARGELIVRPKTYLVENVENLKAIVEMHPVAVKPVDSWWSRKVAIIKTPEETERELERAGLKLKKGKPVLVQEYIYSSPPWVETGFLAAGKGGKRKVKSKLFYQWDLRITLISVNQEELPVSTGGNIRIAPKPYRYELLEEASNVRFSPGLRNAYIASRIGMKYRVLDEETSRLLGLTKDLMREAALRASIAWVAFEKYIRDLAGASISLESL